VPDDRLARLEADLEEALSRLGRVEERLSSLEQGAVLREGPGEGGVSGRGLLAAEEDVPERIDLAATFAVSGEGRLVGGVPLLGRSLLVLGGAFLLRSLTDWGVLPTAAGVAVGLAYALLWLVLADRAAARDVSRLSAVFHGVVAVLLGLPLLWEAAVRFRLLSVTAAAVALGAFTLAALAVAWRRQLRVMGWVVSLGGTVVALALFRAPGSPVPAVILLVTVGVAALWVAYLRHWKGLPWVTALVVDLGVLILNFGFLRGSWDIPSTGVLVAHLLFFVGYVASFGVRTLVHRQQVGAFEGVQTALAVLLGYRGAVVVAAAAGALGPTGGGPVGLGSMALGVAGLLLGLGSYGIAFTPGIREERRRNFFFYTTLALLLVLFASSLVLPAAVLAGAWATLGVLFAWLSGRYRRVTLGLHNALYLVAAALASGLALAAGDAFVAAGRSEWASLPAVTWVVLAALAISLVLPVARTSERWGTYARVPSLLLLVLAVWTWGGTAIALTAPAVAAAPGGGADVGSLAALRTVVLALGALLLALASRWGRYGEARWLVYPLLVVAGIKLLAEDIPHGSPGTLFVALAVLGAVLIAAPRLLRKA